MLHLKVIEKQWLKLYGIQVKSDNLASRSEIRFHQFLCDVWFCRAELYYLPWIAKDCLEYIGTEPDLNPVA